MLLHEKIESCSFSASEQNVISYILQEKTGLKDKTIKEISKETYAAPSTLIRIAKKLGFDGWNAFRNAYLDEVNYLNQHFKDIDPNLPFVEVDDFTAIASKLMHLNTEAIQDTNYLIDREELTQVVNLIAKSEFIQVFAVSGNLLIAQDFQTKMSRINKKVLICLTEGEQLFAASNLDRNSCAIVISYSGETISVLKITEMLYKKRVPIIGITSIGENTLTRYTSHVLRISTREKLYSKIANFSVNYSISYLLDLVYSCYFSLNYQKNLDYKIMIADLVESNRHSTSEIIDENRKRKRLQQKDILE